jgi:hypothetical protein
MDALARTAGIGGIHQHLFEAGFAQVEHGMVQDPVGEAGGMDGAPLGVVDGKGAVAAARPARMSVARASRRASRSARKRATAGRCRLPRAAF